MKKLRIILIVPMMVFELLVFAVAMLLLITTNKETQNKYVSWAVSVLPNRDWYFEGFDS